MSAKKQNSKKRQQRLAAQNRAAELISQKKYFAAVVLLQELVQKYPQNPNHLYSVAVCQRNLGQAKVALQTLERLERLHPKFPGTWLERGRIHHASGEIELAVNAFTNCVSLNPAYIGGWQGILSLSKHIVDPNLLNAAKERYEHLASLDQALVLILRAFHDGQTYKAEQLCREYLKHEPQNVEAMRILARIGTQYGSLDDVEFLLESACEFSPNNRELRLEYIDVLHKRQQYSRALKNAEILVEQDPDDLLHKMARANQQVVLADFESALETYDEILEKHPDLQLASPQLFLSRGHAHKTLGNTEQSIEDYRSAYHKRIDFGDAYWSLANLKTYRFTPTEMDNMLSLVKQPEVDELDRVHIAFALGKSLEDQENYEESFRYYQLGNDLNRKRLKYKAETMTQNLRLQREICTKELLESHSRHGNHAPDPIFVVGLPRAGSTLLEQILASHSEVEGTRELHHIGTFAQKLNGRQKVNEKQRYPGVLKEITPTLIRKMGDLYLEETRDHRVEDKPFFIDKMPNNFRHIGLISSILPNAKIIDARRHPMSCSFSCYKQLFASGQEFTYGQKEIATYYRDYDQLMDHWDKVLPGKVLRVYYEDVVDNLETQVRRILDYCGLPFEESCLQFYNTKRAVRTPSAEQVRQPIYREGLDQWEHYAPWLHSMRRTLGESLRNYPYS